MVRLFKLPFVAWLARPLTGEFSNSRGARARRRLENDVARLLRDREVAATFVAQLTERVERLNARLNELESVSKISRMGRKSVLTVEQILDLAE